MKSKTLIFIIVIIAICSALLYALIREQSDTGGYQKLFPDFAADTVNIIEQLDELNFEQGEQMLRLRKGEEDIWQVAEKEYFPADVTKIRDLLRSLAEAEKIEEMSSRPEDYAKLGIADTDAAEGAGILVEMADANRRWQLIAGDDAAYFEQGQYIRLPDENQSWLINRRLKLDLTVDEWLDKYIIHIEPEDLHRIVIERHDGSTVSTLTIVRDTKGGELELANLAKNRKMKSEYLIRQIASATDYLQFQEVFPKDDSFLLPDYHIKALFTTFDGLEFTMQSYQIDEESYAIAAVDYNDNVASRYDTFPQIKEAIQSDNIYLAQLYNNWYYKLLSLTYDSIDMELDDLTTEISSPQPEQIPEEAGRPAVSPIAEPQSEMEPAVSPIAEPQSEVEPAVSPIAEPQSEVEPAVSPIAEPQSEVEPVISPVAEPQSEAEPVISPVAEPQSEAEPAVSPVAEPQSEAEPAVSPVAEPQSEAEPAVSPVAEPQSEVEPAVSPVAEPQSEAEPAVSPVAEPQSEVEPAVSPVAEPQSEAEPAVSPIAEPQSEAEPAVSPVAEPQSEVEPAVSPVAEPQSEAEPAVSPVAEPQSEVEPAVSPVAEPQSEVEPTVSPVAEPQSEVEPTVSPIAEPQSEAEPAISPVAEPQSEAEPAVSPVAEPQSEAEPAVSPVAEPQSEAEPAVSPVAEPQSEAEPAVSPVAEPQSDAEPAISPVIELQSEAEPTVSPIAEPQSEAEPTVSPVAEPQSDAEPTVSPVAEPQSEAEPAVSPVIELQSDLESDASQKLGSDSKSQSGLISASRPELEPQFAPMFTVDSTAGILKSNIVYKLDAEPHLEWSPVSNSNINYRDVSEFQLDDELGPRFEVIPSSYFEPFLK